MVDLGMELHGIGRFVLELEGGIDHVGRGGDDMGAFREDGDAVAMGHPDLGLGAHALEQRRVGDGPEHRPAVFAGSRRLDLSATGMGQILGAIADAEQRYAAADRRQVRLRGIGVPHAAGAAGEDDTPHGGIQRRDLIIRIDLAEDARLPQATPDELRYLRSEIENENLIHGNSGLLVWKPGRGDGFPGPWPEIS